MDNRSFNFEPSIVSPSKKKRKYILLVFFLAIIIIFTAFILGFLFSTNKPALPNNSKQDSQVVKATTIPVPVSMRKIKGTISGIDKSSLTLQVNQLVSNSRASQSAQVKETVFLGPNSIIHQYVSGDIEKGQAKTEPIKPQDLRQGQQVIVTTDKNRTIINLLKVK